jgi:hypothetical protein
MNDDESDDLDDDEDDLEDEDDAEEDDQDVNKRSPPRKRKHEDTTGDEDSKTH